MKFPLRRRPPEDTAADLPGSALNWDDELTSILADAETAFDNFIAAAQLEINTAFSVPR